MTCCPLHIRTHAKSYWRRDPTRTSGLRRRFIADLRRRFARLEKLIRMQVVERDFFGLSTPRPVAPLGIPMFNALRTNADPFVFQSDAQKVTSFMDWLNRAQSQGQLSLTTLGTPATGEAPWWRTYIQTSYRQGLAQAAGNLSAQGATVADRWLESSWLQPVHADRAAIIYTRTYSELAGITAAMDAQISRTLAQGIASGIGARELARELVDDLEMAEARALRMARTEVINAHAEASLNAYEEAGVEDVAVLAEFVTADDDSVCPKCDALSKVNGGIYPLDEARGLIPVHPNCRCAWVPLLQSVEGIELR